MSEEQRYQRCIDGFSWLNYNAATPSSDGHEWTFLWLERGNRLHHRFTASHGKETQPPRKEDAPLEYERFQLQENRRRNEADILPVYEEASARDEPEHEIESLR